MDTNTESNQFFKVQKVQFNGFFIDPTSSRFDLNIEYDTTPKTREDYAQSLEDSGDQSVAIGMTESPDGDDKESIIPVQRAAITKKIDISYGDDDEVIDLKVKRSMSQASSTYNTYTAETAFLIPSVDLLAVAEEFFDEGAKAVGVIKRARTYFIGIATEEISLTVDVEANENTNRSKGEMLSDLKAYETPTNIHDINISFLQHSILKGFQVTAVKELLKQLVKQKLTTKAEIENQSTRGKFNSMIKVILHLLESNGWSSSTAFSRDEIASASLEYDINMFASSDMFDNELISVAQVIGTDENMKLYSGLFNNREMFPFIHFERGHIVFDRFIDVVELPIMDFQAGSAKAYFDTFDRSGINAKVIGTELRNATEMPVSDERYHVTQGANFMLYKSAYKNTFERGNNVQMTSNMLSFLNPPYTSDDSLAKESVLTLSDNMLLTGLFPTKMVPFLRNNITGHFFNISKELTGYNESNAPERFIYVIGRRFTGKGVRENSFSNQAKNVLHNIDAKTVEDAIIEIRSHLSSDGGTTFDFEYRLRKMSEYYMETPERVNSLSRQLDEQFSRTDALLSQASVLQDALKANKRLILDSMSPIEVLKTEKVFPELREFVEDGNIEYYSFKEIASNIPLLVYYRDNHPAIFNLVRQAAEELGVVIPVEESKLEPFSLSDPQVAISKDLITSEFLGMMKLYYYPSLIDLHKEDDKALFVEIVKSILERNNDVDGQVTGNDLMAENIKTIEQLTSFASKAIVKNQPVVQEGTYLAKEEVFVLVDKYENDIAKLDISLTDFYYELEERKIFDLYDYVELAQLGAPEKKTIIVNFLEYINDILVMISEFNDFPIDTDRPIHESRIYKEIQDAQMKHLQVTREFQNQEITNEEFHSRRTTIYIDFSKSVSLDIFFKEQLIMPDSEKEAKNAIMRSRVLNDYLAMTIDKRGGEDEESEGFDKKMLTRLANSVANLFKDKELHFFESPNTTDYLSDLLSMAGVRLESDLFNDFTSELFDTLAPIYTIRNSLISGETRFAKILVEDYFKMNYFLNIKRMSPEAVYDKFFSRMLLSSMGLKPHQFNESERFTSISGETKLELLFWEMRSGKSRSFIAECFMLSMLNKEDATLLLETKNIQDIATQMLESFPFMFFSLSVYGNKSGTDIKLNPNLMFSTLDADIFPNIPKLFQDTFTGRGDMATTEMARFTQNFENLIDEVQQRIDRDEIDIDQLKDEHRDSMFLSCLDACDR